MNYKRFYLCISWNFQRMTFVALFLIAYTTIFAQSSTINGTVVDDKGEAIIGASVRVKGTSTGTITDVDGKFVLTNVPANGSIQVSYVGYNVQTVNLAGKTHLNITLKEDAALLDEIVVVGYGVQKKSDVTGALTRVNSEQLTMRPVDNAFQALQGKAAGVDVSSTERPGEVSKIRVRGRRSLNADLDPLYVVDGVPLQSGGIEALNPRDIESIDVLKDASSTAIYGSRGANGVILVTTKRGKSGMRQLNYSGSFTFENIHDLSPMMSASDYIMWRRWAYYNSAPYDPQTGKGYASPEHPTIENDRAIFDTGDATAFNNILKGWENGSWDSSKVTDTDWTKFVTQTGITQEHSISANAGNEFVKSFVSFGYLNNKGTQKGQEYERYNGTITTDITATPWLTMGGSVSGSWAVQEYGYSRTGQTSSSGANDIYTAAKNIYRYALPYDEEGNIINYPGGNSGLYTVIDEWNKSNDERQTFRALGSFYADFDFGKIWKPLDGLSYKLFFGPDFRYYRGGVYIDKSSAVRKGGTNIANWGYNRQFSWTLDNQITYNKDINKDNRFTLTLLQSASSKNTESASMSAENIPKPSYMWNNMESVDIIATESKAKMDTGLEESQLASYMARLHYAFKDRYMLTTSIRYDGASVLAEGNKWHPFYSGALAWRMEQEDFLKDINWINQLKLRLGLGTVGSSAIGPYGTLGNIMSFYVPFGGQGNTLAYTTNEPYYSGTLQLMANPDLGWEYTTTFNYGLDYSFFKGRINGALDIYNSHTKDLLMLMNIPTLTGYSQSWANIGETKNFGVELTLNAIPVQTNDFEWNTTLNAAYQKDEIVSLANGKQDMPDNFWFIGNSISVSYGFENAGIWQESDAEEMAKFNAKGHTFQPGMVKPVDQNGDDKITSEDRVILGNKNPRWTLGWSNTFSYKGLELYIELYGRLKYMIETGGEGQTGINNQREIDYWTPANTGAEWQKPIYSQSGGDSYSSLLGYLDGSFIKIRNVSLGYVFPHQLCKSIHINNLKVYAQLKNPGTLYSEVPYRDQDLGTRYYNRGITFGLQLGF